MPVSPRTILLTLIGAHLVNDLHTTVLPAFLPAVAEEFDLDYSELGVLSFAFILLTGVLQPVLGNRADRSGRRRFILVLGFAIGAIGFLVMAVAPSFWFIVLVSLLVGLGGATYHPQATAFIVSAYPDSRGRCSAITAGAVHREVSWPQWRWSLWSPLSTGASPWL
jgi:FSR family fosmidomycin resistance protein-like MFS transporter